jgi:acetoin utilization deacetylase AcuC-like enzyme
MRHFFDPRQLAHAPIREMHNGDWADYVETPARAAQIGAAMTDWIAPGDHGRAPIEAVHDTGYLDFLESAWSDWHAAGREGDAIPYVWPVVGRRDIDLKRIDGRLGRYSFDSGTPIAAGTWKSAYWSAQTALSALDAVLGGDRAAFALCRPPGHHAGADYCGGYCYLNNAAIAAEAAVRGGAGRVAILDVDYHHGNGTQDIFYARGDVGFVSIHADPATDYPFYWGHADECGAGPGAGLTLNLPLPTGTGWDSYAAAVRRALETITGWSSDLLIVSFGADTYEGDPISKFALRTEDYRRLGAAICEAGLPTAIIMEGGYAVDALGSNVAGFLAGFVGDATGSA